MGGDSVVELVRHQPDRVKGNGGSGGGGRRGQGGGVTEGTQIKTPGSGNQKRIQVANLTNYGQSLVSLWTL